MSLEKKNYLRLRLADEADGRLLWDWVNDPDTRKASFRSGRISWRKHKQWLRGKLQDPNCLFFIAVNSEGVPLGQVRFEVKDGEAEVDVTISPQHRGTGYGGLLLRESTRELLRLRPVRAVQAFIKPENQRSMKAFERARFKRSGRETRRGDQCFRYILVRKREK